jgi:deoxycytidine triphosphate deaminase
MSKETTADLAGSTLDELLKTQSIKQLVEKHTLEKLEKRFGIDTILGCFSEIKQDPYLNETGVLSSVAIENYVDKFDLICPFTKKNLKPASYYLSLGDEYALGGKTGKLTDEVNKNKLVIPPFEVAIVKTKEIINMPRFLIGRWNIRVTVAYKGLLWVGGPQVDPGWVGHLFCPIYNLSDQEVELELGEQIATMDFVKTTGFDISKEKQYQRFKRENARKTIKDYDYRLKSALFTNAAQRIDNLEKKVSRVESLIGIALALVAVLFTGLAIFVSSIKTVEYTFSSWMYLSVVFSVAAVLISLFSRNRSIGNGWFKMIVILYIVASAIVLVIMGFKVF